MSKKESKNWIAQHPALTIIFGFSLILFGMLIAFKEEKVNDFTEQDLKIIVQSLEDEIHFGGCTSYNFNDVKISMICDDEFSTTGNLMIIKRIEHGIIPKTDTKMSIDVGFYLRDGTIIDEFPKAIVQN